MPQMNAMLVLDAQLHSADKTPAPVLSCYLAIVKENRGVQPSV